MSTVLAPPEERLITGEELACMTDSKRSELINGRLIWLADPAARTVYAYRSTTEVREFGEQAELVDAEVLPGFSVKVAKLFEI